MWYFVWGGGRGETAGLAVDNLQVFYLRSFMLLTEFDGFLTNFLLYILNDQIVFCARMLLFCVLLTSETKQVHS